MLPNSLAFKNGKQLSHAYTFHAIVMLVDFQKADDIAVLHPRGYEAAPWFEVFIVDPQKRYNIFMVQLLPHESFSAQILQHNIRQIAHRSRDITLPSKEFPFHSWTD